MEEGNYETPQKLKLAANISGVAQAAKCDNVGSICTTTPRNKKLLNPRTPSGSKCGINSMSVIFSSPPSKRVRNPFEAALAERLHLPLIASPSLFQRPNTPQLSSTQFEWTIEEFSSLRPANVEPHETQFHDSFDPEYEAKAQSAISSFFKEQKIVPSPVDCPLRNQRIIFTESSGHTPISKPGRRIRDVGIQTELTLPVDLPKELADALRPYFQPQLAGSDEEQIFNCDCNFKGRQTPTDIKDVSLRRKLFDMHNIVVLDANKSPPCEAVNLYTSNCNSVSSPLSITTQQRQIAIIGKLSDSLDKSSCGSLSPITTKVNLSISPRCIQNKSELDEFLLDLNNEVEQLSPILPPMRSDLDNCKKSLKSTKLKYRINMNSVDGEQTFDELLNIDQCDKEKFTLERSSSPLRCINSSEHSTSDKSFNVKISRLMVNCSKVGSNEKQMDALIQEDNAICDEALDEEDEMQMSHHSPNCSSSNSDTPRSRRRSVSRKNLSQSFTTSPWLDEEVENEANDSNDTKDDESFNNMNKSKLNTCTSNEELLNNWVPTSGSAAAGKYRTDSGFNDMTSSCFSSHSPLEQIMEGAPMESYPNGFVDTIVEPQDVSMTYCSTPTAKCANSKPIQHCQSPSSDTII